MFEARDQSQHPTAWDDLRRRRALTGATPPAKASATCEAATASKPPAVATASNPMGALTLAEVDAFLTQAARTAADLDNATRIDQIAALEQVKSAAAAAQARLTVDLYTSQREADQGRGLPAGKTSRSVGTQIALARRDSPHKGNRHLGLAKALVAEMPHTLAALTAGIVSEWQATLLVRATACLTQQDRTGVDTLLAPRLGDLSDRRLDAAARAAADRLDPAAAVNRRAKAESDRRVTTRPAPDCMTQLSALLPVKDGVACHAALKAAADTARAAGDPRTRGQVMADTLVQRLTGHTPAVGADIEVRVVMSTDTFLGYGTQSARVPDYGTIPADLAYAWAHAGTPPRHPKNPRSTGDAPTDGAAADVTNIDPDSRSGRAERARVFLRRMFATPDQSRLVAMETGRREFTGLLAEFLNTRDQTCRTPYCDAPIRHHDHVTPHATGGPTTATNGQGLCEACNYLKQHPDWTARPGPHADQPHQVTWTTPTGHTYHSTAPPPLGD
ncbi:HNH endonuclease [Leekyejoonella antrihumi]|uniref:DUF222 domain-containing protein n=1 Tax=Leekyejoonella antrihumi TaxID=1660198 RepID=A0A563DTK5_9MICO|nr:HNH endonuclease signature motif containing protein [Leekyejoonella antrihumi]TWP33590.1 DUF222 domain-containing protein [Leekyejoonella antrihumi]